MTQQLVPFFCHIFIELIQRHLIVDRIDEGQGGDEHTGALLKQIICAVKDRHTDAEPGRAADPFEINGQCHIECSERRNTVALAEGINCMV